MKSAADGLRGKDLESAAEDQEKAVEELKKALDEIEQRLAQLREDTLIDKLARLEARFRGMLERQKEVTAATASIHARQEESGKLARADRIKLRKLAAEESALAEEAYQTIDILVEDGTSVVFPRVVTNLQEDLQLIAKFLTEQQTGEYTQTLQQEAEVTLQELIDALQRNLKKKKGGGGGACDCEPPLLPGSAELKLLRSMQVRVNRRTSAFDKLGLDAKLDAELEQMRTKEAQTLTELQEEVAEMTLELSEKY
jgi:paraquat-inducible protein B